LSILPFLPAATGEGARSGRDFRAAAMGPGSSILPLFPDAFVRGETERQDVE
jgi:hypothetical protein